MPRTDITHAIRHSEALGAAKALCDELSDMADGNAPIPQSDEEWQNLLSLAASVMIYLKVEARAFIDGEPARYDEFVS